MSANVIASSSNGRDSHGFVWAGRGGRSFYGSNQTSTFKATGKAETLKEEIDELGKYVFNHGGADDAKEFEEATEKIFKYMEKNIEFLDCKVHSIEDGVLNNPDKPTPLMKPSPIPDGTSTTEQLVHEQGMELNNDELELHWVKQKKHVDMIMKIASGMRIAYVILWEKCIQYMKSTLESMNEFDKTKLNRDPMNLHQLILKFAFNYEDHCHLPDTLHSVILALYSWRQANKVSDQEYYEMFKAHYEVVRRAGGCIGQHPALIKVYKDDGKSDNDAANSVKEAMAAVIFLKGADLTRWRIIEGSP